MELLKDIAVDLNMYESLEFVKTELDDKYFKEFIEVYIKIKNDDRLNKYKLLKADCMDHNAAGFDFSVNKKSEFEINHCWVIFFITYEDKFYNNMKSYTIQSFNKHTLGPDMDVVKIYDNLPDALNCLFDELKKRDKLLEDNYKFY